ncbi:MAG: hypothetical protein ACREBN_08085 [Burkholderiaceae bacterium]
MLRLPTVPGASSARPSVPASTFRRITFGQLAALAAPLAACASLLAFVVLHQAPLPEESVLLAASMLGTPGQTVSPLKSSL